MPGPVARLLPAVVVVLVGGCAAGEVRPSAPAPTAAPAASVPDPPAAATDPALRGELLVLLAADQEARAGDGTEGIDGDRDRAERLRQIVEERGWPTRTLVGADGATAAWAIAQHSDLDPQLQQRFLDLMRAAAAAREADPGELAYLVDRVAANAGQPQTYGTQAGCTDDGSAQPAPLADPDGVDALRSEAGLAPLDEYLAELAAICAGGS